MIYQSIQQMKKQLGQIDKWLTTALAHAESKKFDSKQFLGLRLIVDQFAFVRQVQIACDTLKQGASRLSGKDAPAHPDTEETIEQLQERVRSTIAYLDGFSEKDFVDAPTRSITQPRWEGKTMFGADFFLEHVQPNFFFHLGTTYSILRHNGVPLGKRDYLGALTQHAPK
jgi:uncharacterized protein